MSRKRSPNFTESELQILLDAVEKNKSVIFSKLSKVITNSAKKKIWEKICSTINATNHTDHTHKVVGIIGETPIEGLVEGTDTGSVPSGDGSEPDVTFPTCPNSRRSSNSSMENEPSCSFWTDNTKDSWMTGEAPIAKSAMKSIKILEDKTTQSLIAIEERRLKTEEERLRVEKQRLTMESERLDIEGQRFNIEQQKHQLYLAQMYINVAQMGVQVLDQQTLNTPDVV
ncbi:unnamed protein product [Mytilus coruscus]|uniref:Myb/SANT-like DNA-binding domain-containing protein 4 n=1 Tax=Mytilus coruscus TaxID=42192 RepID=A0A6J8AFK7_MYTCO|nr:unnamed protein product [Mytilus coruscus]